MEVVWSKPALRSLSQVLDYTIENFGSRQVSIISEKINQTITRLQFFPLSSAVIETNYQRELRVAVVVKTLKILYEVSSEKIIIHFLWNSNMNIDTVLDKIQTID